MLFNPDPEKLKQNIDSIQQQVEDVFIIDNGSTNAEHIRRLLKKSKAKTQYNYDNLGIATALNQLCETAEKEGYEWILTLDQDTYPPNDIITQMIPYIHDNQNGILCPAVLYEGWNELRKGNGEATYITACMTSGSLTRIKAWKEVNGFRDEYFIDYVDNEFCMKLARCHYKVLRVNTCMITHKLGEPGMIRFLGKEIKYTRHSALRYYYMVRNNRAYISEYKESLRYSKEIMKLWYIIIRGIIFSKCKRETIKYIFLGYKDAINHKMGKYKGVC